jgi:hypothetical protein
LRDHALAVHEGKIVALLPAEAEQRYVAKEVVRSATATCCCRGS